MTYTLIRTKLQVWDQVLDEPAKGSVIVTPTSAPIKDVAGNRLLISPNVVHLDADGWYEADLAPSDDPGLSPTGFGYTFDIRAKGFSYQFTTQIRLADATLVTEVNPETLEEFTHYELDLTGLAPVLPEVPISEAQALRDEMLALTTQGQEYADEAQLYRDQTVAVGNTNDTINANLVNDDDSAFRAALTRNGNKPVGRGELVFNVMDFGAVGDGSTDDYQAFTDAMIAARASSAFGPAVVWAPWTPKGYRLDNGLAMQSRVTLRGERRVRIRRTGTGSPFFVNSNAVREWTIEGFTFDDSLGLTGSSMIRLGTNTRDYTIRNNRFIGGALGTSRAVISKKLISNVATIELDEAPTGLEAGSIIHISQVDATFNGDHTATAVSMTAPYTVTFDLVGADVASGVAQNPLPVYDGWLNGETRRTVISKAAAGGVGTIETSAAHGYSVGQTVYVFGVEGQNDGGADVTMNGSHTITAVPDATHFSYATNRPDIATTASGGTVGIDTQNHLDALYANAIDHQNGVVGGLIEDNWFDGLANSIRIPDTQQLTVQRNLFTNWTTRCLYIVGQTTSASEDLILIQNRIRDMHIGGEIRQAIAIQGVNDTWLHKRLAVLFNTVIGVNKSWSAPDPGGADQISLQRCEDFRVIGNFSGFGGDLGINVSAQCRRGVIALNICEHNDTAGINVGAQATVFCDTIDITGNTLVNNGQARNADRGYQTAISLAGFANHILIDGNVIADDQDVHTTLTGIRMTDTTDVEIGVNLFTNIAERFDVDATCSDIRGIPVGAVTLVASPNEAGHNDNAEIEMWAHTIEPWALEVGQVYKLRVHGTMDFVTPPGTFNLRFRVGGALAFGFGMVTTSSTTAATNVPWCLDVDVFIEAIGPAGVTSSMGTAQLVSGNSNARNTAYNQEVGVTHDLSDGLTVSVGANTATPNAGNIVRVLRATMFKQPV